MDPITQGVVGINASQLVSRPAEKTTAALFGFFAGMAADLDVLIFSPNDPLLSLEYHRHFTHSLVFIPVGALLCAWVLRAVFKRRAAGLSFSRTYIFCFAGYATHALLDACTTYGTQLFWPFSDTRVAWNNVSVIDPLFTLPLIVIMVFAVTRASTKLAMVGFIYAITYLGLGIVQQYRALDIATQYAVSRGHDTDSIQVKPSFANIILWKSVYEYENKYYVDAVRVLGSSKVYPGTKTSKLNVNEHFPWLQKNSQQAKDIKRFAWFSNQYLGIDPDNKNRIIDIRYSLIPNQMTGMWGIVLNPQADLSEHVHWDTSRPRGKAAMESAGQLWQMILGQ